MPRYRIFNFDIESDIPLPCDESLHSHPLLPPADFPLEICFSPKPDWAFRCVNLTGRRGWGAAYDVEDGIFLSTYFGGAMHFSQDGNRIGVTFDFSNPEQRAMMGAWIINLGLGICSLLRGQIPLHGASAEISGQLLGIMAPSGTGKSTLLWRLLQDGALFSADDQLPVCVGTQDATAMPALSLHAKLSHDALHKRGGLSHNFSEVVPGSGEFWVPIEAAQRTFRAQTPAALIILQPYFTPEQDEHQSPLFVRRHAGAAAVPLLMANTHSLWAMGKFVDARVLARRYIELSHRVPVLTLHYQRTLATLPRVAQVISEIARHPMPSAALAV